MPASEESNCAVCIFPQYANANVRKQMPNEDDARHFLGLRILPYLASKNVTRFKNRADITRLREFVGGRHSRQPGAEHDNPNTAAGAWLEFGRPCVGSWDRYESHGRHHIVDGGGAARAADKLEELTA